MRATAAAIACLAIASPVALAPAAHATTTVAPTSTRTNSGAYHLISPTRIVDTRSGTGTSKGRIGQDATVRYGVSGKLGIPATGVSAVVVNLTAINTTKAGYLTAYASGTARPATSSVNFGAGWTGGTNAIVPVGADGKIAIYNHAGTLDLAIDIVGWYSTAAAPGTPGDLAMPSGMTPVVQTASDGTGPVSAGTKFKLSLGMSSIGFDPGYLEAVQVNVTAVNPKGNGYVTAWNGMSSMPNTSVVNVKSGVSSTNSMIVPAANLDYSEDGSGVVLQDAQLAVQFVGSGSTDLIISVGTYYIQSKDGFGFSYTPQAPRRALDSRTGLGIRKARLAGETVTRAAFPSWAMDQTTAAVNMTTTVAAPTQTTYFSQSTDVVGAAYLPMINTEKGANRSNNVLQLLNSSDSGMSPYYGIYNDAGYADVVGDITGRMALSPDALASGNTATSAGGKLTRKLLTTMKPKLTVKATIQRPRG